MRVAYGNEGAPQVVAAFADRFGVHVIDAFGATEGGLAVTRVDDSPPGSVGLAGPELRIMGDDGQELPAATFDPSGARMSGNTCDNACRFRSRSERAYRIVVFRLA